MYTVGINKELENWSFKKVNGKFSSFCFILF